MIFAMIEPKTGLFGLFSEFTAGCDAHCAANEAQLGITGLACHIFATFPSHRRKIAYLLPSDGAFGHRTGVRNLAEDMAC